MTDKLQFKKESCFPDEDESVLSMDYINSGSSRNLFEMNGDFKEIASSEDFMPSKVVQAQFKTSKVLLSSPKKGSSNKKR